MYSNVTQASPLKNSLKKAFAAFSLTVLALTVFAANIATVNAASISTFGVVDTTFNPDKESADISFNLTDSGNITLEVFDGNSPIRTLAFRKAVSSGQHTEFSWDGRDSSGTKVSEGTYKVQLFYYSETFALFANDNVTVSYTNNDDDDDDDNGVSPAISSDYASPNPFDPDSENTYVYFNLNTGSDVTLEIYNGSSRIDTILTNNYLSAGAHAKVWDGRNSSGNKVSEGTYTYKITAENDYGTDTETGSVTVEYEDDDDDDDDNTVDPNISNAYASPETFDPEDNESTTIHYTVNTCVYVTAKVYKSSNDSLVKTLESSKYVCSGTHTLTWNGKNSSGNIVTDGDYYIRITVTNSQGSDWEEEDVTIDTDSNNNDDDENAPTISDVDVNPYTFDPDDNEDTTLEYSIDECADVTIEVSDDNGDLVDTLKDSVYQCEGDYSVIWDGEDDSGDIVDDGIYTFEIWAENSGGDDYVTEDVEVDTNSNNDDDDTNGPDITNVTVNPDQFDPRDESTLLKFRVDECVDATVKVVDDDDDTVKTLFSNKEICSGYHSYTWNGKDSGNDYVDDGNYEFVITVENDDNEDDTARADVEVDSDGSSSDSPRCADYDDVSETNPYCDAIEYVTDENIFSGYPDGTFKPYQFINRAETAKVILVGFDYTIMPADGTNLGFSDVSVGAWYMPYLRTAKHYGIIKGYPDGTFRPDNTVNRVELLKLFLETADVYVPACSYQPYNDTPVNEWYSKYVCYAKTYDLMDTDVYGNFNPSAPMTRGDVAELFLRFHEEGLDDEVGSHNDTGSTVSGAPDITSVSLSYDAIKQGGSTKISYKLNVKADVTVEILDEDDDVVRTLVDDVNQTSGTHSTTWDSEDDDGDRVPEGTYTVKIRASNSKGSDKVLKEVEVDNSASTSTTGLKINNLEVERDVWNPSTQGYLDISFETTKTADVTVAVYDEDNDLVRYLWDDVSKTADDYVISWNGRDRYNNLVSDGTYTIKVTAVSSSYGTVKDEVEVEVNR